MNADLHMSPQGNNMISNFEGTALRAYKDAVGVVTIGRGITNSDPLIKELLGRDLQMGDTITPAQETRLFEDSIELHYAPSVRRSLPENSAQPTFDAGLSFHYNTGAIARATWPKALARDDRANAKASLMSWNKAGGRALSGLTRRRAREWSMIESGDYGPEGRARAGVIVVDASGKEVSTVGQPPAPYAPGMLKLGDRGREVHEAREWLVQLGLMKVGGDEFDDATDAAVRKFQSSHPDLTADGVIGPATRNQLIREVDARRKAKATVTKTVATGAASTGGLWLTVGKGSAAFAAGAVGVLGAVVLVYLAYTYRSEIVSALNRLTGRAVP